MKISFAIHIITRFCRTGGPLPHRAPRVRPPGARAPTREGCWRYVSASACAAASAQESGSDGLDRGAQTAGRRERRGRGVGRREGGTALRPISPFWGIAPLAHSRPRP